MQMQKNIKIRMIAGVLLIGLTIAAVIMHDQYKQGQLVCIAPGEQIVCEVPLPSGMQQSLFAVARQTEDCKNIMVSLVDSACTQPAGMVFAMESRRNGKTVDRQTVTLIEGQVARIPVQSPGAVLYFACGYVNPLMGGTVTARVRLLEERELLGD